MTEQRSGLLLVHGDEPHLVDAAVQRWREGARAEVEVLDAPSRLEPLIASLVDMPLFAAERNVLVRDLPQLTGARRGASGSEELVRALGMRAPSTYVCFSVRSTVASGNPVLGAVTTLGGEVIHHPQLRGNDRRQWLDTRIRARGVRLPAGGADLLMRCSAGDLGVLETELDKLAAHGEPLTADELGRLVSGTEQLQLYSVLDSLAGSQPATGAALLGELIAEGRSPQHLLSILAGQLRDLLLAHAVLLRGERSAAAVAASLKLPGWRAERVLRTARSIPASLAIAWMRDLQRIDAGLKAGEVDDVAALQRWGLRAAESLRRRQRLRGAA